ncbi:MAG: hypothetical protein Q4C91_19240 [Eubacteriales bacterium]|nr:hypothetical protein [Eubacteriales bacterium]
MEEQKNVQQEEPREESGEQSQGMPSRSYILQMLAGAYLLYTGYRLCKNVLDGIEGASWGFFAAGAAFIVIGCVMLFVGVRGTMRNEKEKKAIEAAAAAAQQETAAQEDTQEPAEEAEKVSQGEKVQEAEQASRKQNTGNSTGKLAEGTKKTMSIAERARLVSRLEDEQEDGENTENTEE